MPIARIATIALLFTLAATAAADTREKVGRAVITFYWNVDESSSRYRGKASAVLRDPAGNVIAHTSKRFKVDLVRQGSGWLRDGRTVIFVKRVGGESRFRVTSAKYGLGTNGCPLVPYRTIAVDRRFVRIGSKVYIPQLKGARLPDGTIHDGMFIASDSGHFRGAHVDLFVGTSRGARPFTRKGYRSRSHVTIYTDGRTSDCEP